MKHVSDDQKTHKNPNLRGQAAVRAGPKPFSSQAPRPAATTAPASTQPPVLELEGKKWRVVSWWLLRVQLPGGEPPDGAAAAAPLQENHEGAQNLVIGQTELKQVVYVFKCNKSTLQVKGKINAITLGENQTGGGGSCVFTHVNNTCSVPFMG